jgi:hypothetical protein
MPHPLWKCYVTVSRSLVADVAPERPRHCARCSRPRRRLSCPPRQPNTKCQRDKQDNADKAHKAHKAHKAYKSHKRYKHPIRGKETREQMAWGYLNGAEARQLPTLHLELTEPTTPDASHSVRAVLSPDLIALTDAADVRHKAPLPASPSPRC